MNKVKRVPGFWFRVSGSILDFRPTQIPIDPTFPKRGNGIGNKLAVRNSRFVKG
jgi:hypothetical protein